MSQIDFYDLMYPASEVAKLRSEIDTLKQSVDKLRKALFARHNTFLGLYVEQQEMISALKETVDELKAKLAQDSRSDETHDECGSVPNVWPLAYDQG